MTGQDYPGKKQAGTGLAAGFWLGAAIAVVAAVWGLSHVPFGLRLLLFPEVLLVTGCVGGAIGCVPGMLLGYGIGRVTR